MFPNGKYFLIYVISQIHQIFDSQPVSQVCANSELSDISCSFAFTNIDTISTRYISVVINVDGMSSAFQSNNYEIWPLIWPSINLPPNRRKLFKYLLFVLLYHGECKPTFSDYRSRDVNCFNCILFMCCGVLVQLKVVTISADLLAKATRINMVQFNGYHGCSNCLKGQFDEGSWKMLFPVEEPCPLRNPVLHLLYIADTESFNKHLFVLLSLIRSIPCVTFDILHLIH